MSSLRSSCRSGLLCTRRTQWEMWPLRRAMASIGQGAEPAAICRTSSGGAGDAVDLGLEQWHPRQPWIAAADARGRVQVIDIGPSCGSSSSSAAAAAAMKPNTAPPGGPGPVKRPELLAAGEVAGSLMAVLTHEVLQQEALSLSWSPTSPGLLAVGSVGVVPRSLAEAAEDSGAGGEVSIPGSPGGNGHALPVVPNLMHVCMSYRVTSLSWSSDGRMLAAASPSQAGLQVWDISTGISTSVGAGLAAFDTVRWSPCGDYVFAAGTGSRYFYIFETHKWRWARWQIASSSSSDTSSASSATAASTAVAPGGVAAAAAPSYSFGGATSVVAAAWAPSAPGRNPILLAALSGMSYLVAVHLVDSPPGLTAQLLPVVLPELHRGGSAAAAASVGGRDAGAGFSSSSGTSSSAAVADLTWDPRGERLAVLFSVSPGQVPTCIALYSTITDPLVSARLIGLARPSQCLCDAAGAAGPGSCPVAAGFNSGQQQKQQQAGPTAAAGGFEAGPSQPRDGISSLLFLTIFIASGNLGPRASRSPGCSWRPCCAVR
ncbi:hypothetical protein VOLCADRAFT_90309 [Volvox carteri f. nagariensis]|uniref:Uncharacterized protein n=1 Tax=Volvox carteri f. nagariensis TaxID=3068 RepID=D8TU14_VOLCA|nr:uncharacterized protein VOLCADRAFT_90309 [Volvox carteri f. nagariensis]EFJ48958.1 hypothetical protein VOLCADRAFT_90309 [Volvox carteri f. nagariensis]|eukprot:XP_002949855.1 hypothetical protein VOLCADRAFT_90309 [Volvox carteri f. nagariensis]